MSDAKKDAILFTWVAIFFATAACLTIYVFGYVVETHWGNTLGLTGFTVFMALKFVAHSIAKYGEDRELAASKDLRKTQAQAPHR